MVGDLRTEPNVTGERPAQKYDRYVFGLALDLELSNVSDFDIEPGLLTKLAPCSVLRPLVPLQPAARQTPGSRRMQYMSQEEHAVVVVEGGDEHTDAVTRREQPCHVAHGRL